MFVIIYIEFPCADKGTRTYVCTRNKQQKDKTRNTHKQKEMFFFEEASKRKCYISYHIFLGTISYYMILAIHLRNMKYDKPLQKKK